MVGARASRVKQRVDDCAHVLGERASSVRED